MQVLTTRLVVSPNICLYIKNIELYNLEKFVLLSGQLLNLHQDCSTVGVELLSQSPALDWQDSVHQSAIVSELVGVS